MQKYAEKLQSPIEVDLKQIEELGVKPILGDYLTEEMRHDGLVARHNTLNVAHDVMRLMMEVRETPVVTSRVKS